jgi:hypothetical protein
MPIIVVDTLTFDFPAGWTASKYDDWSFYRNRFRRFLNAIKAVDVLAISPDKTLFLIEVKDYRRHRRSKTISLADELAKKVLDTLAAMLPSKINGDVVTEIAVSDQVLKAHGLRVILHLEQPIKHSKLFPRAIDPADVQMKIRQRLKPVDAHPLVVEMAQMRGLPWTVNPRNIDPNQLVINGL